MRSIIGLSATFGTLAGGYLPTAWGASDFSLQSLLFSGIGGIAGVWLGIRLSSA